ncbi:hypothetical protein N2152v2_005079 [Parachlorella kessleri]
MEQDENDQFVPADVFLKQLGTEKQLTAAGQRSNAAQKRASLAQLGGIRNKISLWERKVPGQAQKPPQQQPLQQHGPALGQRTRPPALKPTGAAPRLAPVEEEEAPGEDPLRRLSSGSRRSSGGAGNDLYSRVGAAAAAVRQEESDERRESAGSGSSGLLSRAAAAMQAVLPSPGTKQARAARQEAVRFPSIMFGSKPPPKQPARSALPKPRESFSGDSGQWQLATALQPPAATGSNAATPAAAAMAAVGVCQNDDASDSSSEWHDASEIQVVLRDDESASVSSEATTVVPEADDGSTADSSKCRQQPPAELPRLQRSDSPTLPTQQQQHVSYRRRPVATLAASEVFHSAVDILPVDGSLALAASASFSLGRASLLGSGQPENPAVEEGVGESGTSQTAEPPAAEAAPVQSNLAAVVAEPAAERAERTVPHEGGAAGVAEAPPAGSSIKPACQQVHLQALPQDTTPCEREQLLKALGSEHGGAGQEEGRCSQGAHVSAAARRQGAVLLLSDVKAEAMACVPEQGPSAMDVLVVASPTTGAAAQASPQRGITEPATASCQQAGASPLGDPAMVPAQLHQAEEQGQQYQMRPAAEAAEHSSPPLLGLRREFSEANLQYMGAIASPEDASPFVSQQGTEVGEAAPAGLAVPLTAAAVVVALPAAPEEEGSAPGPAADLPLPAAEPSSPYAATEFDGDDVIMGDAAFTPAPATTRHVPPEEQQLQQLAAAGDQPTGSHSPTADRCSLPTERCLFISNNALPRSPLAAFTDSEQGPPSAAGELQKVQPSWHQVSELGAPVATATQPPLPPETEALPEALVAQLELEVNSELSEPTELLGAACAVIGTEEASSLINGELPSVVGTGQIHDAEAAGEQTVGFAIATKLAAPAPTKSAGAELAATEELKSAVAPWEELPAEEQPSEIAAAVAAAMALPNAGEALMHSSARVPAGTKHAVEEQSSSESGAGASSPSFSRERLYAEDEEVPLDAVEEVADDMIAVGQSTEGPIAEEGKKMPAGGAASVTGSHENEAVPTDMPAAAAEASPQQRQEQEPALPEEHGYELAVLEAEGAAVATVEAHDGAATREGNAQLPFGELLACASAETSTAGTAEPVTEQQAFTPVSILAAAATGLEGLSPGSIGKAGQEAGVAAYTGDTLSADSPLAAAALATGIVGLHHNRPAAVDKSRDLPAAPAGDAVDITAPPTSPPAAASFKETPTSPPAAAVTTALPTTPSAAGCPYRTAPAEEADPMVIAAPIHPSAVDTAAILCDDALETAPSLQSTDAAGSGGPASGEAVGLGYIELPEEEFNQAPVEELLNHQPYAVLCKEPDEAGQEDVDMMDVSEGEDEGLKSTSPTTAVAAAATTSGRAGAADATEQLPDSPSAAAALLGDCTQEQEPGPGSPVLTAQAAASPGASSLHHAGPPASPAGSTLIVQKSVSWSDSAGSNGSMAEPGASAAEASSSLVTAIEAAAGGIAPQTGTIGASSEVAAEAEAEHAEAAAEAAAAAAATLPDAWDTSQHNCLGAVGDGHSLAAPLVSTVEPTVLLAASHASPAAQQPLEGHSVSSAGSPAVEQHSSPHPEAGPAPTQHMEAAQLRGEQPASEQHGSPCSIDSLAGDGPAEHGDSGADGGKPPDAAAANAFEPVGAPLPAAEDMDRLSQGPPQEHMPPSPGSPIVSSTHVEGAEGAEGAVPGSLMPVKEAAELGEQQQDSSLGQAEEIGPTAKDTQHLGQQQCHQEPQQEESITAAGSPPMSPEGGSRCSQAVTPGPKADAGQESSVSATAASQEQQQQQQGRSEPLQSAQEEAQELGSDGSVESLAVSASPPSHSPSTSFQYPLSAALTPAQQGSNAHSQGMPSMRGSGAGAAAMSPTVSSGAAGGSYSSNNPLFAGTPGHPTPPSVTLRTFPASRFADGTPLSSDGSATPASLGIKLAERLQEVASQLQQPAAKSAQAAGFAVTPGAPASRLLLATPRTAAGAKDGAGGSFDFAADVAAMLQALDQRTPATALVPAGGRAAALATTVQRPRPARFSAAMTGSAAMFDLEGFDVNGNNSNTSPESGRFQAMPVQSLHVVRPPAAASVELTAIDEEVATLRSKVAELEAQREEAVGMLAGYQGSIAQLQDAHSAIMVKAQAENACLMAEVEQLRGTAAETERQFNRLYHTKYLPLKAETVPLRQEVQALSAQLGQEQARAHKAEQAAHGLQEDLATAREQLRAAKGEAAAALAAAAAARQSEQQAELRCKAEAKRSTQALAAAQAELAEVQARYATLTRQYDEVVHKANLARQARERAAGELGRKEEEICALELRTKELESVLLAYKKENAKFYERKEQYKAHIADLERQVQEKENEKEQLLSMCDDLMGRIEREGLTID